MRDFWGAPKDGWPDFDSEPEPEPEPEPKPKSVVIRWFPPDEDER